MLSWVAPSWLWSTPPAGEDSTKRSRMFWVVRWIRESGMPPRSVPSLDRAWKGNELKPQLHRKVPAPNTQTPLGAWYTDAFEVSEAELDVVTGDFDTNVCVPAGAG